MNATEPTIQETVALLKEVIVFLMQQHDREATWEWGGVEGKRYKALVERLGG